jgi:hypothetical protein
MEDFRTRKEERKVARLAPQAGSKGKGNKGVGGKHKKKYKKIIKFIEGQGFMFASDRNKLVYKHPDRKCQIVLAQTSSDTNAPAHIVQVIKKVFSQCQPPIDLSTIPAEINLMRMAGMSWQEEKDKTMEDVLDSILLEPDYERVSTDMTTEGKNELKLLAEKKGITMGELIEQMMAVYKDNQ